MKFGYTLAETLITISIVGIVAAVTLPIITSKIERHKNVIVLKRAYSDLHNYLDVFNVEYDCDNILTNCAPEDGEFIQKFGEYLIEKQNFKNIIPENCVGCSNNTNKGLPIKDSAEKWSPFACYKTSASGRAKCLTSPTGEYAFLMSNYMYDNFYIAPTNGRYYYGSNEYNNKNRYRSRIFIVTQPNKVDTHANVNLAKKTIQRGKNAFELYITNFKAIIPGGAPYCNDYYCHALDDTNCSKENQNFSACLTRIINDGWKIKYDY